MPSQSIDLRGLVQAERDRSVLAARDAFDGLLAWVQGPAQKLSLFRVEHELLARVMALGLTLVGVWLAVHLPDAVSVRIRSGQGWYHYRALGADRVRTRFGVLLAARPVYALTGGKGPATVAPEDRAIGLCSGRMSLGVHLLAAWLAARTTFDEVGETLRQFGGYVPSKRAVLGVVDELGPQARRWMEVMPAPEDDGEVIVIQTDCKGAPMVSSPEHAKRCQPHVKGRRARSKRRSRRRQQPRVRRGKGKRSKNARMATVAVVYTLKRGRDGKLEGPLNKRVLATFAGKRRLFEMARREAELRGLGKKNAYFLADGDRALWALQKEFFPTATPCVDWYHVCEYLWTAGTSVFDEGSKALASWVHDRKTELLAGDIDAVFSALDALRPRVGKSGPGTKGRRERLAKAITFLDNHREWLNYADLERVDMDIATGAVEGAINYVIGRRLDGSMMRWCPTRADNVLALRCVQYNGHWDPFAASVEAAHARRRSLAVPRVTPQHAQVPYDAVRKAA